MENTLISGDDLIPFLPHRGRNLVLDHVDKSITPKGPQAQITLEIKQPDPKQREIFLEKDAQGNLVYSPYLFAEFLALGSIVLLTDLPPDTMAYFSTITNYKKTQNIPASGPLKGVTVRNKDRGLFKRFTGHILSADGTEVVETDIMAFAFNPKEDAGRQEKKISEKPVVQNKKPIPKEKFSWKPKEMVFIDDLVAIDPNAKTALFSYTYPTDHPFTEGHFPGNPIMMGITQWLGCADALTWFVNELAVADRSRFTTIADIEAVKEDGTVACEIRGLKLSFEKLKAYAIPFPQLLETKRIGFRDIVHPKETLYYRISNFQIEG